MWSCNGSASPVCPARRVLSIVTPRAVVDEMDTGPLASQQEVAPRGRLLLGTQLLTRRPNCGRGRRAKHNPHSVRHAVIGERDAVGRRLP